MKDESYKQEAGGSAGWLIGCLGLAVRTQRTSTGGIERVLVERVRVG